MLFLRGASSILPPLTTPASATAAFAQRTCEFRTFPGIGRVRNSQITEGFPTDGDWRWVAAERFREGQQAAMCRQ